MHDFTVYRLNDVSLVVLDYEVEIPDAERVIRNCDRSRVIFDLRAVRERYREPYATSLAEFSERLERQCAFVGVDCLENPELQSLNYLTIDEAALQLRNQ